MLFFYGMRRYGKANASSRFGVCQFCGTAGTLETYDTAQFLHLYWIPLIPAGHVKVIDACPHCEKCRIISPRKFRKARQQSEAALLDKLRETPDNPDLACEALGHWAAYNDRSNFEKMASLYQSRMPGNPEVMKAIAYGYMRLGDFTKAADAARLLPESEPRRQKLLEEAEAHAEVEGSQYGKVNKPKGVPIFLPYLVPLLIVLAFVGNLFSDALKAGKAREVWVVNGSLRPYTVQIDGTEYNMNVQTTRRVELPMGKHDVKIKDTQLPIESFSFEYDIPFSKRINDDKLLVLNPDGLAFMVLGHIPYIADGSSRTADPRYEYVFGKKWYVLDKVDYAFRDSPQNIDMPSGQSVTYKTELTLYEAPTYNDLINTLYEYGDVVKFAPYAEAILQLDPDTSDTSWMLGVVLGTNDLDSLDYLRQGLEARPVLIDWHRFYQTSKERLDPEYDLVAEYQALLDADPDDPALKYLRGRVEPDFEKSIGYFLAAEQAPGCRGYGYYAAAYNMLCHLKYDKAMEYAQKAVERENASPGFSATHASACLATHQYEPLIASIRDKKAADPDNGELIALESRYLHLMGRHDEALQAEATYFMSTTDWMEADTRTNWENYFDSARCYAEGDIEGYLEKLQLAVPERAEYQRAFHEGNAQAALDMLTDEDSSDFKSYLIVYGTAMHHGQIEVAKQAMEKATATATARPEITKFLVDGGPLTPADLTTADILPEEKLLVATTLGFLHPDQKKEYLQLAETCNYSPFFPQILIKSWTE